MFNLIKRLAPRKEQNERQNKKDDIFEGGFSLP